MAADGSIIIATDIDNKQAQKELNSLTKKIDTLQNKLNQKQVKQSALAEEARQIGIEFDNARKKLDQMQSGETFYTSDHIKQQQKDVSELEKEWNKVGQAADKLRTEIYDGTQEIDRMKSQAGDLQRQLASAAPSSQTMANAMARMQKSAARFSTRLKSIVASAFVFNVLSYGLRQFTEWLGKAIKSNDEANAAISKLKGALLTLVQPLVSVIIPAFTTFVNILSRVVSVIAQVIATLFGSTAKSSAEAAESLYNETSAIEGVGKAAEEAAGSLAGFDEINTISTESASSSGGGAYSSDILPDFSEAGDLSWLSETLGNVSGWVTVALLLGGIALIAIGACAGNLLAVLAGLLLIGTAVVVGTETGALQSWADTLGLNSVAEFVVLAILLGGIAVVAIGAAMGNIMMVIAGLALIGAVILYTEQSGMMESWTEEQLSSAASYVTAALLLGGIVLVVAGAAMGNVLMAIAGLGLLAAGVYVGVESGTLADWAEVLGIDTVFDYVVAGIQLAGIALVAIGAAMGNIFMVVAGAVILAAGVTAELIGEETLSSWWEVLQLTSIQQWVAVALLLGGISLIAIGAAMGNILMIFAGFVMLSVGTISSASEGNLKDWVTTLGLEKAAGWVTAGLLIGGIALVVFGILTANIFMVLAGLGLLGAGISVGVTSGSFSSWLNTISSAFKSFAGTVIGIFEGLWSGLKGIINGIIGGIEWLANKVIDGINIVIRALNNLSFTIPSWVPALGGKSFGFSIKELAQISIPRLADGAVIPPNREFLAVLGDQTSGNNIETPENLLRQIVREESGNGDNSELISLLESILTVLQAGQIIKVNETVLGRTTAKAINKVTQSSGKAVLLY